MARDAAEIPEEENCEALSIHQAINRRVTSLTWVNASRVFKSSDLLSLPASSCGAGAPVGSPTVALRALRASGPQDSWLPISTPNPTPAREAQELTQDWSLGRPGAAAFLKTWPPRVCLPLPKK